MRGGVAISPATATVPARSDAHHHQLPDWRSLAACRSADPADFTSPRSSTRAWRSICDRCPVAEPCLWAALVEEALSGYRYGIRGATTPGRRARIVASLPRMDLDAAYEAAVADWAARR